MKPLTYIEVIEKENLELLNKISKLKRRLEIAIRGLEMESAAQNNRNKSIREFLRKAKGA